MEARPYRKKLGKPVVFHFLVQQSTFSCSGHLILTNKLVLIYEASAVFELSSQMYKLDLERQNRDQTTNIHWIIEIARKFQKNIYFCFIDYAFLTLWITTNCGKFLERWKYQTILPVSWETCMQVKKQQLKQTWNNGLVQNWERSIGRLYTSTLFINCVQSTSCEITGWMNCKMK